MEQKVANGYGHGDREVMVLAHHGGQVRCCVTHVGGKRGIILMVFKQPGANVIETVDKIKAALPRLRAAMPPALHVDVLSDRTQAPSGVGYALENRIVSSRSLPEIFDDCGVQRLAAFFRATRNPNCGFRSFQPGVPKD